MANLGDAYIDVHANTSGIRSEVRRSVQGMDKDGDYAGQRFNKGFRNATEKEAKKLGASTGGFFGNGIFGALKKVSFGFAGLASAIVPVGPALAGVVAALVAVTGAASYAVVSSVQLAGVFASLLPAVIAGVIAFQGFGAAVSGNAAAMAKLAPSAQAAAKAIASLKAPLADLRKSVQGAFFSGLAEPIRELAKTLLPILQKNLTTTAGIVNVTAREFLTFLNSAAGISVIDTLLKGLNLTLANFLPALANIAQGFLYIFAGAVGPAESLSQAILDLSTRFVNWAGDAQATGKIAGYLDGAAKAAGALIGVIGNLGGILHGVFGAGTDEGVGLLNTFKAQTQALEDLIKSAQGQNALNNFFALTGVAAQAFGDIMKALKPVFAGLGAIFAQLKGPLADLRAALKPLVIALGKQIGSTLKFLAPVIGFLAKAFVGLIKALSFLKPVLLPIAAALAIAFGGPVTALIATILLIGFAVKTAWGILKVFSSWLGSVFGPIFSAVGAAFKAGASAIVEVFKSLWTNIKGIWASVGQPVFDLIKAVVSLLVAWWQLEWAIVKLAFRVVWTAIKAVWTSIGVPVFNAIKTVIGAAIAVVKAIWNTLKPVFSAVWTAIKGIWNTVGKPVFDAIVKVVQSLTKVFRTVWDGLTGIVGGAVRSMTKFISGLVSKIRSAISAINSFHNSNSSFGSPARGFTGTGSASGSVSYPGGLTMVGERGRELVNLPRGSRIYPNHQTERIVSSTTNNSHAGVNVQQIFTGPTTGSRRNRELDWTLRFASAASAGTGGAGGMN